MKARPILFSAPMILALLDGRKTQTRRLIKGVPSWDHYGRDIMDWGLSGIHQETYDPSNPIEGSDLWHLDVQTDVDDHSRRVIRCPYGAPGDVLWARESGIEGKGATDFRIFAHDAAPGRYWVDSDAGRYGASYGPAISRESMLRTGRWKVRPSIYMPRWASRLTLQITDVRVERLQDITEADALAEGLQWTVPGKWAVASNIPIVGDDPRRVYFELWDHINGTGTAEANPWVWALTFTVHQQNVDAFMAAQGAA